MCIAITIISVLCLWSVWKCNDAYYTNAFFFSHNEISIILSSCWSQECIMYIVLCRKSTRKNSSNIQGHQLVVFQWQLNKTKQLQMQKCTRVELQTTEKKIMIKLCASNRLCTGSRPTAYRHFFIQAAVIADSYMYIYDYNVKCHFICG
jgi:hypothetical protein